MAGYEDGYWASSDGLKLHYRDYAGDPARPPLLCLPGLTRNARDYAALAERLAGQWRLIAVDFRGRGKSEYAKDAMSYVPPTYAADVTALLDALEIPRFVPIGTSLGGLVTMLLAHALPGRIAGALLNDVGPEIDEAGLARIRGYVGKPSVWPTWMHAARALSEANADVYPQWDTAEWLAMAKRLYRLNSSGRVVLDYDLKLAEPFRVPGGEAPPDLWALLTAFGNAPMLVVRGERSDILSDAVARRMVAMLGDATLVTIPDTGHAPTLDEPAAVTAIDGWLARVAREPAPA